jgi:micrococcal nuclease
MDGVAPDPWLLVHARRRSAAAPTASAGGGKCAASYPDECIPPPPPDLDCSDIPYRNFRVVGRDAHHFDGNHNDIGCET